LYQKAIIGRCCCPASSVATYISFEYFLLNIFCEKLTKPKTSLRSWPASVQRITKLPKTMKLTVFYLVGCKQGDQMSLWKKRPICSQLMLAYFFN
jgi:hypothetical protein